MAKAKPATETTEAPVLQEATTDPVIATSSATDGVEAVKVSPVTEAGVTTEAVSDIATAAQVEGTSEVVDGADGSTDVSTINDAAFDQVMKRFVSQGKTVVVKGPEKGRWRAGRHFTMEPTSIPLIDLTEAELEKLCGDPLLTVAVVDAPY